MAALIAQREPVSRVARLGLARAARDDRGGDDRERQARELWRQLGVPLCAIAVFLLAVVAARGAHPDEPRRDSRARPRSGARPAALVAEHRAERAKRAEFYARQDARNAAALRPMPDAEVRVRKYTGKPTFFDQILTSLATVFTASCSRRSSRCRSASSAGLSPTINAAINPLMQIFKPVSPLAWLPIVTMVVSARLRERRAAASRSRS